jgi:hypothetical protein
LKHEMIFSLLRTLLIGFAFSLFLGFPLQADAQGADTAFTYQGRLLKNGSYVNGVACDLRFGLYGNLTGGAPLGSGIQSLNSAVSDGYFSVVLNFGVVITGTLYLETAVQCPGDAAFNTLSPRVTLHPAPYAGYALSAPWSGITGVPAGIGPYTAGTGLALNSSQFSVVAGDIAGTGLTASGNKLNINFAGTGSASTSARSDHNHDADYINAGETAGGGLTGTFPNPSIAANAIGMAETRETMGRGTAGDISDTGTGLVLGGNYLWPTTTTFTPEASGRCMVTVTADVSSPGSENGGRAWVRAARNMGGSLYTGSSEAYMTSDSEHAHLGSTTVADIISVAGGQSTQFGCYIYTSDSSWTDDEHWHCAVAYLCQ